MNKEMYELTIRTQFEQINELSKENKELEKTIETLNEAYTLSIRSSKNLQDRIDKAIEYVNYSLNNQLCDEREALKYTLDILRGKDNENNK